MSQIMNPGGGGGGVTFGPPTGNIDIGDAQVEGASANATRADHQHVFTAPAAGYPVNVDATAEADGTATTPARSDHRHAATLGVAAGASNFGDTAAEGTATALARADHRHSREAAVQSLTEISVPALGDDLLIIDDPDGVPVRNAVSVQRLMGNILPSICEGRLTTETGVPISTADRTAQGTIYFTPYLGNRIALYDGTRWRLYAFAEVSLALVVTSGNNYDVFLYDNAGTLTLELSAAWTNDTTRADALTTQDAINVKSGAATRRWLGTIRANGANVVEDSLTKRFVWNHYNRIPRPLWRLETTSSWTYTTVDTWRQANASTANQLEAIIGHIGVRASIVAQTLAAHTTTNPGLNVSIGFDSTTTPATGASVGQIAHVIDSSGSMESTLDHFPGIGYHKWVQLEGFLTAGTATFYGDLAGTLSRKLTGICGTIDG